MGRREENGMGRREEEVGKEGREWKGWQERMRKWEEEKGKR